MPDRIFEKTVKTLKENMHILLPAFLAGFAAYMFAFTNKLPNHDDVMCLFNMGTTLTSGRWGLEILWRVLRSASMPWLHGLVSLNLLCFTAWLTVKTFRIENRVLAAILAASIVTFPSQTVTYGYMFTAVPYALSLMLAVLSVYVFGCGGRYRLPLSVLCLNLALGIYQAYIGVAAGFFVVMAIQNIIQSDKSAEAVLKEGLISVAVLVLSALCYYLVNIAFLSYYGMKLSQYSGVNMNSSGVLSKVISAYRNFVSYFYSGHFDIIRKDLSGVIHYICAAAAFVMLFVEFRAQKNTARRIMLVFCVCVLPLAINCVCLISAGIHNLMTAGMTSLYVLTVILTENTTRKLKKNGINLLALALLIVTISNVTYANQLYTKMYLQFEEASAFYTGLVSRVMMTPEFDENSSLAIIGGAHNQLYDVPEIDTEDVAGVQEGLINIYSREQFIRYYTGFDIPTASMDEINEIMETEEYKEMPEYPYYGSVCKIGDCIVVKLS